MPNKGNEQKKRSAKEKASVMVDINQVSIQGDMVRVRSRYGVYEMNIWDIYKIY